MKRKLLSVLFMGLLCCLVTSCSKDEEDETEINTYDLTKVYEINENHAQVGGIVYELTNDHFEVVTHDASICIRYLDQPICSEIKFKGKVYKVTTIRSNAFMGNYVTTLRVPEGISNINSSAFHWCLYLKDLYLPASTKALNAYLINDCGQLQTIHYAGTKTQWNKLPKATNWKGSCKTNFKIVCKDGTI